MLLKDFGLEVWESSVRLEPDEFSGMGDYEPSETTVTFLMMPGSRERRERWELAECETDDQLNGCVSGYGIPVQITGPPSER